MFQGADTLNISIGENGSDNTVRFTYGKVEVTTSNLEFDFSQPFDLDLSFNFNSDSVFFLLSNHGEGYHQRLLGLEKFYLQ